MSGQLLAYVPVIHAGYEALLDRYPGGHVLLLGRSFAGSYPVIAKEIRALDAQRAAHYLRESRPGQRFTVVETSDLPGAVTGPCLVLPDEELLRAVATDFQLCARAELRFESTFLRWDRPASLTPRLPIAAVALPEGTWSPMFAGAAADLAQRSSDWWRQVGALVARDGVVLAQSYNTHLPSEYSPYINGDPRADFKAGERIDVSTALHAEAGAIAAAASSGVALRGADIYVSTFPCPGCARLIAAAGIARCFYSGG